VVGGWMVLSALLAAAAGGAVELVRDVVAAEVGRALAR
jgi:hypothetical protein